MNKRRVVITGLGTLNSVGHNVSQTWDNLLAGKSGIDYITKFDTEGYTSRIAGEIKDFDSSSVISAKEARKMDLYSQYALYVANEAMQDAGLTEGDYDPFAFGIITGVGIGGMLTFEEQAKILHEKGPRRISPFFIPMMISNIAAAHVSIKYGLKGVCFNAVSACASANHAIGTALRHIQTGDVDLMLAGGMEAAITPIAVAGFCSMRALSTRNDEPAKACSPFDVKRDGFIMAEGAGLIVMEELEHAKARGAKIYAEVIGYGATADAYHITAPRDDGEGGVMAMVKALRDAGIEPNEVDYINAHGTSTPLNDKTETLAIKTVFGEHAKNLKISSTKSMVGHSLGAAAGIEAVVCAKTLQTGKIHPTINLEDPDSNCDLDYVPGSAINHPVNVALSNSLGFGGQNGVVIFKKY